MPSLIGNNDAKLDTKGRVFMPAAFRRQLGDAKGFVLRKSLFGDCLVLYPEATWDEMIETLRRKLNRFNRREEQVFRQFVAEADRVEMEDNGRMLIPRRYLTAGGSGQDVRFVGCDTTIEMWPQNRLEENFLPAGEFASAMEALLADGETGNDN